MRLPTECACLWQTMENLDMRFNSPHQVSCRNQILLPFPTSHLVKSSTLLCMAIIPLHKLKPWGLLTEVRLPLHSFLIHLISMIFFQRLLSSFRYLPIHFSWRALFMVVRDLSPNPPNLVGHFTSSQLTRWYALLPSTSPQRNLFWMDSSCFATYTGIVKTNI